MHSEIMIQSIQKETVYIATVITLGLFIIADSQRIIKDGWDFEVLSSKSYINIQTKNIHSSSDLYIYETLENYQKKLIYYKNKENEGSGYSDYDFGQYIENSESNMSHIRLKHQEDINKTYPIAVSVVDEQSFAKEKQYSINYDRVQHILIIIENQREQKPPDVVGTRQEFWVFIALVFVLILVLVFFNSKRVRINFEATCYNKKDDKKINYNPVKTNPPNGPEDKKQENHNQP